MTRAGGRDPKVTQCKSYTLSADNGDCSDVMWTYNGRTEMRKWERIFKIRILNNDLKNLVVLNKYQKWYLRFICSFTAALEACVILEFDAKQV